MLDLESIELIKQLKARYFRFLDTADFDGLATVFTPDATAHFQGGYYEFELKGWPALRDFYQKSFTSTKFGTHNAHHPEITVANETATGIWYLQDTFYNLEDNRVTTGSAFYHDKYVRQGGEWLIVHTGYKRVFEEVADFDESRKITVKPIND